MSNGTRSHAAIVTPGVQILVAGAEDLLTLNRSSGQLAPTRQNGTAGSAGWQDNHGGRRYRTEGV